MKQLIVGWINYYRIGNFKTKCKQIDGWLRFRIRMCIWKQWKTSQKRIRMMMKLGVSRNRATRTAYSRKGYARIAISQPLSYALRNEVLKYNGLVSLLDQYQLKHI
ncbi:group II intron maturase-specific domain-containing protein [Thomasclavelia spiroformis]|uniref:group II intron maturase-specific domain-containing protein n=1 Tax=Thomasclavelia spiroformis TaxID=29348 RepID=UPI0013A60B16